MKNTTTIFLLPMLLFYLYGCSTEPETGNTQTIGMEEQAMQEDDDLIHITPEQFALGKMETGRLAKAVFPYTVHANGYIDVPPRSKAAISVYYGGYVKGLDLLPGQHVRKGQVLFTLENPDFVQMQQDYLESIAQLDYLKTDFERQKTLAAENIASQKNYLKAESDFQVQQARSEGLKKRLEMLGIDLEKVKARDFVSSIRVYAPIGGTITAVNVSGGSFLNTSDIAVEITSTDHLHLELDVFERDIPLIKEGQKIIFRVPGANSKTYAAIVHLIGGVVEGENRIVRVHGHLEDESGAHGLIPGMYVEASVETAVDSVMAIPEEAVVTLEEDAFVLIQKGENAEGYHFERKQVRAGRTVNGMTEILEAQDWTEPVLIKGAFNLISE